MLFHPFPPYLSTLSHRSYPLKISSGLQGTKIQDLNDQSSDRKQLSPGGECSFGNPTTKVKRSTPSFKRVDPEAQAEFAELLDHSIKIAQQ